MVSFMAQGANQAIEDAAVLACCIQDAGAAGIGDALARYEQIRRPRASQIQRLSRERADHNHLPDGERQSHRDAAFAGQDPLNDLRWLYGHDAEAHARNALRTR
jgi:salicylate hydroxylase